MAGTAAAAVPAPAAAASAAVRTVLRVVGLAMDETPGSWVGTDRGWPAGWVGWNCRRARWRANYAGSRGGAVAKLPPAP
ncbi:hypothetical protein GCM10010498_58840 [Streptomyces cavourensis]|nr:hypothetical protein GCM10010498_58840 [Streptomyces cavourensis]